MEQKSEEENISEPKNYEYMMKGHDSQIVFLKEISTELGNIVYSICKEGDVRGWNLQSKEMVVKIKLSQNIDDQSSNTLLKIENGEGFNETENSMKESEKTKKQGKRDIDFHQIQVKSKGQSEGRDIIAVDIFQNMIFGSYLGGNVCCWDLNDGTLLNIYKYTSQTIKQIKNYMNKELVLGSQDFSIRFINIEENCIERAYKLNGPVNLMQVDDQHVYAISDLNNFYMININVEIADQEIEENAQQQQKQFEPIHSFNSAEVHSFVIKDNFLYAGTDDCCLNIWNIEKNFRQEDQWKLHVDGITSVIFLQISDKEYMVTGSKDHTIIVSDLKQIQDSLRERRLMQLEHLWSAKFQVWYGCMYKKKVKTKKKAKN